MYVNDLDLCVTVQILEGTPAVLSLGKLCKDHGYSSGWVRGQNPHFVKKWAGKYDATRRIACLPLVRVWQLDLPARLPVHPLLRYRRTQCEMILRHVQQPHELGVHAVEHWEISCEIPKKPKTKMKKEDIDTARGCPLRDLPLWLEEFTETLVDEEDSASRKAPASISRDITASSGTSDKSGIGQAHHFSHPERPKLRCLQEDQHNTSSLQKTH